MADIRLWNQPELELNLEGNSKMSKTSHIPQNTMIEGLKLLFIMRNLQFVCDFTY